MDTGLAATEDPPVATAKQRAADLKYALIAKRYGMKNSLRTAWEARDAGIKASLGFALIEQESGNGANLWGHDGTIFVGGYDAKNNKHWGAVVTEKAYREYKRQRGKTRMQGVGPPQLTWWQFQDSADELGGCWKPKYSLRYAFRTLRNHIGEFGYHHGIAAYNGGGRAAQEYAWAVEAREKKWHRRLYGA